MVMTMIFELFFYSLIFEDLNKILV